ncbi:hypothetical protein, partial [Escherichia coli]|uniref:hypothetical protein n=1 Tax=Escherichia coli TaxID=562 RepID=UPI001BDBB8E6
YYSGRSPDPCARQRNGAAGASVYGTVSTRRSAQPDAKPARPAGGTLRLDGLCGFGAAKPGSSGALTPLLVHEKPSYRSFSNG